MGVVSVAVVAVDVSVAEAAVVVFTGPVSTSEATTVELTFEVDGCVALLFPRCVASVLINQPLSYSFSNPTRKFAVCPRK